MMPQWAFSNFDYLVLIGGKSMIVIDFTKNNKLLTEAGILSMLGAWSKALLRHMYGKDVAMVADLNKINISSLVTEDNEPNFIIRGKHRDVKAYAIALVREKEYLDAIVDFGKEHPNTAKARSNLIPAVREFESSTGLKWPFKDEG